MEACSPRRSGDRAREKDRDKDAVGRRGEDLAAAYLGDIGWHVLERNWRPGRGLRGELDIVALEARDTGPGTLVVVEVKTRSSLRLGPPSAGIDARKLARLRALAVAWTTTRELRHQGLRIDVISILLRSGAPALLRHHRGVGL